MTDQPWAHLIADWFGDTLRDPKAIQARIAWWFTADEDRDRKLQERYFRLSEECAAGIHFRWLQHPEGRLALILALDQLPRNLHRGSPRAFACDAQAAALCLAAVQTGQDRSLLPVQRAFLYMPLQHVEDLEAQEAGVSLYRKLAAENPAHPVFDTSFAAFATLHRDIIARFGRFPHRNAVLGRENTPEEAEYLAEGAPTFGQ